MRLRYQGWLSWQLAGALLLVLVCGLAAGGTIASLVFVREAEPMARELERRATRIALLELLAQQQLPDAVQSLAVPAQLPPVIAPPAVPSGTIGAVASARAVAQRTASSSRGAPPAKTGEPQPMRASEVSVPTVASPTASAVAPAADTPFASAVIEPVTGEELFAALKMRIEGVPADKAGVKALDKGAVVLRDGTKVRIGQTFKTGEKLLQVDPDTARVVTSKRQMLLFFQQGG